MDVRAAAGRRLLVGGRLVALEGMRIMSDYRLNDILQTPNGPGRYQGRIRSNGSIEILVFHHPNDVSDELKELASYRGGPSVLWAYPLEKVTQIA